MNPTTNLDQVGATMHGFPQAKPPASAPPKPVVPTIVVKPPVPVSPLIKAIPVVAAASTAPVVPPKPTGPSYEKYLTTTTSNRICALLYGKACSGKTTGALTFPNPIVIDIDGNLPPGTKNVIPIHSDKFVDSVIPRQGRSYSDRLGALTKISADLAYDLGPDHTIIVDSITRLEMHYTAQDKFSPILVKKGENAGEIDTRAMWYRRLDYFQGLLNRLVSCSANVIIISHIQMERDEKGNLTNGFRQVLMGQIGDQLPSLFPTCLYAQSRPTKDGQIEFVWQIRTGRFQEPARVPKPTTESHIPQDYNILKNFH